MSSYGNALRLWAEALLCDGAGSTRVLTVGRFHRNSPDRDLEGHPFDSAERAVNIVLSGGHNVDGLNGIDGYVLRSHTLTVRVSYAITNAGEDGTEAVSEQDGSATLDGVQDRAASDEFDIASTLQWSANYAGVDPAIVCVNALDVPPLAVAGQSAVLEVPFEVLVWATVPGKSGAVEGYAT